MDSTFQVPAPSSPSRRSGWRLLLALLVLGTLLRLPTFLRPLLSDDEAIYATTADAMLRGDRLYRDVVDHKPPLIYHVYRLGFDLFGQYDTQGAHVFVVLSVLATAGLLFAIKRRDGDDAGALAAAAMLLVFSTTWHDYDALAANCELFVLPPQALAAWLLVRASRQPPRGLRWLGVHAAIGGLVGLSALFKYQGMTFLGVSVGVLVWQARQRRLAWSGALAASLLHVVFSLVPAALYLGWCVHLGNAPAAIAWFRFNFSYVGAGLGGKEAVARALWRTMLVGGCALVPYALGLGGAGAVLIGLARAWRFRKDDVPASAVIAVLWLATSAIAVCAGGRFFGHYFHLILPPLCLLAAPGFLALWRRGRLARGALLAMCALPALFFFALATFARPLAEKLDEGEPDYAAVAARVASLTAVDDRIFVWGNSPQLYMLARRPMGARFSFCNYMTGESPGTPTENGQWDADRNQLPAAWDMLFADLEARQPTLVVDAAAASWDGYDKFPMARYPRLRRYVDARYRLVETVAGVVLYRRMD